MRNWPTKETEVAAPVVAWLQATGWDVYQEVRQRRATGCSCDIIATRGPLVWAIEAKVQLGVKVIEQAHHWSQFAHYASVAVPYYAARPSPGVLTLALERWGIGVFGVRDPASLTHLYSFRNMTDAERNAEAVAHERQPRLNRQAYPHNIRAVLCEQHRTYLAAGSPCGGGWSPYKATCNALARLVAEHPGITLRMAIKGKPSAGPHDPCIVGIDHHYHTDRTALTSLRTWLLEGKVPGVRVVLDGKAMLLYPDDKEEA